MWSALITFLLGLFKAWREPTAAAEAEKAGAASNDVAQANADRDAVAKAVTARDSADRAPVRPGPDGSPVGLPDDGFRRD